MATSSVAPARGMTGNERRVVAYTSTAHALNHVVDASYGALLPQIKTSFTASLSVLGLIGTVFSLSYGIAAMAGGMLADRYGSRRMLWIHLGATGVLAAFVAISRSPWVLALTLAMLGLAAGMYHPVGLSFITRSVRERSMAAGYHGMAGSLGTAIAPALLAVIANIWQWQASFIVLGLLGLLIGAAVFTSRTREGTAPPKAATAAKAPPAKWDRSLLFPLMLIFGVNLVSGFVYRGLITYLPLHIEGKLHSALFGMGAKELAGLASTGALLLGIGGQYVGGWLGERVRREALLVPLALLPMPFMLMIGALSGWWMVAMAGVFAFFNFMAQPAYTALISDYSSSKAQGSAFGLSFLASFGLGSLASYYGGFIADTWSTSTLFISLVAFEAIVAVLAASLYVAARRRGRGAEAAG